MISRGAVKGSPSDLWPIRADRWNPWKALVEEHPEVTVTTERELPGTMLGLLAGKRIWLCRKTDGVERTCTLAHELVHYERQIFPEDPIERAAEERIVEEITARRLIPFDDLCRVVLQSPNSTLDWWAWHLRVDLPLFEVRLITLSPVERAALSAIRGGPMPAPAEGHHLFDRDRTDVPSAALSTVLAARQH